MSERKKIQCDYFSALDEMVSPKSVKPATSGKGNYRRFYFPKAYCHLDALIQISDQVLQVGLRIKGADRDTFFERLRANQEAIEGAVETPLIWDAKEGRKQCWVYAEREADPTDRACWPEQQRWIRAMLKRFSTVFTEYIS